VLVALPPAGPGRPVPGVSGRVDDQACSPLPTTAFISRRCPVPLQNSTLVRDARFGWMSRLRQDRVPLE
jgi:hypothetical protein